MSTNGKTTSILLVEDNIDDYDATIRSFKKVNFHNPINWCQSGEEAIEFLTNKDKSNHPTPGLILLDLNMPGMDGKMVLTHLKKSAEFKHIPVIILTTSSDQRDVKECYQLGASTYIQKPVSFDNLIEAVARIKDYWFKVALLPGEKN